MINGIDLNLRQTPYLLQDLAGHTVECFVYVNRHLKNMLYSQTNLNDVKMIKVHNIFRLHIFQLF